MDHLKTNPDFDSKLDEVNRRSLKWLLFAGVFFQFCRILNFYFSTSISDTKPYVLYLTFAMILLFYFVLAKTKFPVRYAMHGLFFYALLADLLNHWFIFRPQIFLSTQLVVMFIALMFEKIGYLVFYYFWIICIPLLGSVILPYFGWRAFKNPNLDFGTIADFIFTFSWSTIMLSIFVLQRNNLVKKVLANTLKMNRTIEPEKYRKSNLSREEIGQLSKEILSFLSQDKQYLDPDLNAGFLSKKLNVPLYKLSQVFSMGMNQSFNTVLTTMRIEEAKRRLESNEYKEEKILSIAMDCGFTSKSTFNTYFKKIVGETPKAYRDRILSSHG